MTRDPMEELRYQVHEAIRESKIEELAGCLMELNQVQNDIALGVIPEDEAMEEAKLVTRHAVELHHDLKELSDVMDDRETQSILESQDLCWLDDLTEEDFTAL